VWDDAYGRAAGGRLGTDTPTVSPGGRKPVKPKGQILVPDLPTLQIAPAQ
jgi:hypothetical protein